jgi:hypothetical protein
MNTSLSGGIAIQIPKTTTFFASHLYGGVIALLNPINEIQLSAELEQLRVNVNGDGSIQILKIIGIQDYLWEQVTALATPLLVRVTMC